MADNQKQIVTPAGIAVYPRLNKPDTKFVAEGEFSVQLKFDLSAPGVQDFVDMINGAVEESVVWARGELETSLANTKDAAKKGALKKKISTLSAADSPVKPVVDEDGNETNFVTVRFKAKAQFTKKDGEVVKVTIPLRDAKKNEVNAKKVNVGGGSILKVAALMYPYYSAKDNVSGITFRLRAAQILKLVEFGGGDFGFGEEDGDEIAASQTEGDDTDSGDEDEDF